MVFTTVPDALIILLLNLLAVGFILSRHRFPVERRLRRLYGIDRHWWVPVLAFLVAISLSVVSITAVRAAFSEKLEIIILIFAIGLVSAGLDRSGFFKHVAYRIVERCEGETSRLVIYIYLLTSAATFFTSNDIVILVLTPIIVGICFQAGIENTKLLLLTQFVAANTLSMGLLIGSPTNIILAEEMSIDFFSYLLLMFPVAVVAMLSSLFLLKLTMFLQDTVRFRVFDQMEFSSKYSVPEHNPEPDFTQMMRDWILIFVFFLGLVALVTLLEMSLYWAAIPAIANCYLYWHFSSNHDRGFRKPVEHLPYGVFFFGMTFFIFAEQFSRSRFLNSQVVPFIRQILGSGPVKTVVSGVFGSGFLVNLFNDLPAAALVSQTLPKLNMGFPAETLLIQASLAGLNIGTYVTHIGALAGIVWFNQMRVEREKRRAEDPEMVEKMRFPGRIDLIKYGLLHFLFTGTVLSAFLVGEWWILSALS